MKKLLYIDTFSSNHIHEMFDASSLLMFAQLYDSIDYYGNGNSLSNVEHILGRMPDNVAAHKINLVNIYKPIHKLRRFIKQIQATILNVWFIITAKHDVDIVINYMTAISLYPINWITALTGKKVLIVCHSDIQELTGKNKVSWIFRKSITLLSKNCVNIAKGLWFAVLGESIYNNVVPLISEQVKEKLVSFDHTAIFDKIPRIKKGQIDEKLILGYVGGFRTSKGADVFLDIAKQFKHNPNIEFRMIGHTSGKNEQLRDAGIVIPDGVGDFFISREKMYELICQLDYVLYCFPPEGYRFTASGTVFDAIDCERPILAIRNDYFEGMFKAYGAFGYLEDDAERLISRIRLMINNKDSDMWNLKNVKEQLRPESAAKRFSTSPWFKN